MSELHSLIETSMTENTFFRNPQFSRIHTYPIAQKFISSLPYTRHFLLYVTFSRRYRTLVHGCFLFWIYLCLRQDYLCYKETQICHIKQMLTCLDCYMQYVLSHSITLHHYCKKHLPKFNFCLYKNKWCLLKDYNKVL